MKRVRISFGILCLITVVAVIITVCDHWVAQGCGWFCLTAIAVYSGIAYCIWQEVDNLFAEAQKREEEEKQSKED